MLPAVGDATKVERLVALLALGLEEREQGPNGSWSSIFRSIRPRGSLDLSLQTYGVFSGCPHIVTKKKTDPQKRCSFASNNKSLFSSSLV